MKACLQLQPDVLLQRLPAYYKMNTIFSLDGTINCVMSGRNDAIQKTWQMMRPCAKTWGMFRMDETNALTASASFWETQRLMQVNLPCLTHPMMTQICPLFILLTCGVSTSAVSHWWCCMVYLSLRSGVLRKIWSHIWDNWNFPMFLLIDGSFFLMIMVSLIVLMRLFDFLLTNEKLFTLIWWPVMLAWS